MRGKPQSAEIGWFCWPLLRLTADVFSLTRDGSWVSFSLLLCEIVLTFLAVRPKGMRFSLVSNLSPSLCATMVVDVAEVDHFVEDHAAMPFSSAL